MSASVKSKRMKYMLSVDRDVRKAIEAIQEVYDLSLLEGLSHSEIASISGIDPSALSRAVNGKNSNMTFKTAARIMRAVGHRLKVGGESLEDIVDVRSNFRCLPELSSEWRKMSFFEELANQGDNASFEDKATIRASASQFKLDDVEVVDAAT